MPSSPVTKQTEEVLDEVLQTIRQEYDSPFPVLCETDRNKFVEEEESLREQLKGAEQLDSISWRGLLCLPSPQAVKCLYNAQELLKRLKEDINAKLRTRLTGKSNPFPSPRLSRHGQNPAINQMGANQPIETDGSFAVGCPRPASTIITSPMNMRCSFSESEALDVNERSAQSGHDSSPLESEADDRTGNSSTQRRRRSPPPPRPMSPPYNSRHSSETSSSSGSDSPRRSSSVRRPPPPPPRSPRASRSPAIATPTSPASLFPTSALSPSPPPRLRASSHSRLSPDTSSNSGSNFSRSSSIIRRPAPAPPQSPRQTGSPRSPTNTTFLSPGSLPPDPAIISSISRLTQHINTLASTVAIEGNSGQGQRPRRGHYVVKSNCLELNNSTGTGLTLNNGGSHNSGAVVHTR